MSRATKSVKSARPSMESSRGNEERRSTSSDTSRAKVKRPSGPTQPEDQRKAGAVLLRLLPAAERELRRRSRLSGLTMSAVVSALLMATATDGSPARE